MTEQWRDVPGFEGRYQVSDLGNVRSLPRQVRTVSRTGAESTRTIRGCAMKPQTAWNPVYLQVTIGGKAHLVQHLVALAFIGPRPAGMEVAHNDGGAKNNRASNLRYATPKENAGDRITHGTSGQGEANAAAKLDAPLVAAVRNSALPAGQLADVLGVHKNHISRLRRGERWGHLT